MCSQIWLCRILHKSVSKLFQEGRVELCVMTSHIRKKSLRMIPSYYSVRKFPFSPWAPKGSQLSLCRMHDNSVSKLFEEGKGATLCDEVTHQKAISQKPSPYLLCEDISLFTVGPFGLPNITLQNPLQQCKQTVPGREGWKCLWWSHISESNLSESFSLVLCEDTSFFTMGPCGLPNITLQFPRKEC